LKLIPRVENALIFCGCLRINHPFSDARRLIIHKHLQLTFLSNTSYNRFKTSKWVVRRVKLFKVENFVGPLNSARIHLYTLPLMTKAGLNYFFYTRAHENALFFHLEV